MKTERKTKNDQETFLLGKSLAPHLKPGSVLFLDGDLAAGKTVFAKGVGAGLGVSDQIKSPSYTLLCIYRGRLPFYHFDAYNLSGVNDFYELGFDEYLESGGVSLIEWASVISDNFPYPALRVEIGKGNEDDERVLTFTAGDDFHGEILKEWLANENTCL